jgi:hypothetical protein
MTKQGGSEFGGIASWIESADDLMVACWRVAMANYWAPKARFTDPRKVTRAPKVLVCGPRFSVEG